MKTLPETISAYKKTPVFTAETVPKGLLADHQTKAGTWGLITVLEGELDYTITDASREPEILHHVLPVTDDVVFYVEFYRKRTFIYKFSTSASFYLFLYRISISLIKGLYFYSNKYTVHAYSKLYI